MSWLGGLSMMWWAGRGSKRVGLGDAVLCCVSVHAVRVLCADEWVDEAGEVCRMGVLQIS